MGLGDALGQRVMLDRRSPLPLSRQLYLTLYEAIVAGELANGWRLPAVRALASELGVARNVVLDAYARLAADALVHADGRRGTRIAHEVLPGDRPCARSAAPWPLSRRASTPVDGARALPLSPGEPDASLFPAAHWQRAMAQAARLPANELGYRSNVGERLQRAIARHLMVYRSMSVSPERIVITSGTRQSLALAAALYSDPGDAAWVESPGYPGAGEAWRTLGLTVSAMDVDEQGALERRLGRPALIYLTPCFQYPTGATLSPERRAAFLERSARQGCVLFEDDYDSEFRDGRAAAPALAAHASSVDGGARVVHAGTFSKLLFPAARVAWMVVPAGHQERARSALRALGGGHGTIAQAAVAEVLERGQVDVHLERARAVYARRRRVWLEAVERVPGLRHLGGGGLSATVGFDSAVPRDDLEFALQAAGIGAVPFERFGLDDPGASYTDSLVVGLGNVASLEVPRWVDTLAATVAELAGVR